MDWPHAPLHRTESPGWYFITAGTYWKKHLITESRRSFLIDLMRALAPPEGLDLQIWSVMPNHYHCIVQADTNHNLPAFIKKLHSKSSREFNSQDKTTGRQVWFQYWDKQLKTEKDYFTRVNYIHQNPVKHGLVYSAENYPWSSMREFEDGVGRALAESVRRFKTHQLDGPDDF
jgi:putative transposase